MIIFEKTHCEQDAKEGKSENWSKDLIHRRKAFVSIIMVSWIKGLHEATFFFLTPPENPLKLNVRVKI